MNLCERQVMSICLAQKNINEQKECKFFEQAKYKTGCTWLMFGFHCGNIDAQEEAKNEHK